MAHNRGYIGGVVDTVSQNWGNSLPANSNALAPREAIAKWENKTKEAIPMQVSVERVPLSTVPDSSDEYDNPNDGFVPDALVKWNARGAQYEASMDTSPGNSIVVVAESIEVEVQRQTDYHPCAYSASITPNVGHKSRTTKTFIYRTSPANLLVPVPKFAKVFTVYRDSWYDQIDVHLLDHRLNVVGAMGAGGSGILYEHLISNAIRFLRIVQEFSSIVVVFHLEI